MAKEKKGGKRLNKKQLAEVLIDYFQSRPGETMSMKQVFKNLRLTTHPMKMLALDIMEDMAWNDFLAKDGEYAYRLNTKGQVQEGTFQRKANGKNTFLPDDGGTPIFVSERNSMSALTGDRVRVQFLARRRNHIKEAMVTEILHRKKDTFTGKLRVDRDIAFLVTQESLFVHDILVPKKRLKGGKTGDRAVVRITQWPDAEHKNLVGEVVDVLGPAGDNDVEMNAILVQYGLPYQYPKRVEQAAEKIQPGITAEEIAQNAERDSIKYKMVEFMGEFVGEEFDAHISGVQSYGIYCEIDENHCEGLVPIRDLDGDYYDFDEKNFQLIGRRHHSCYQLGDPVRIRVAQANLERRQLDFVLADSAREERKPQHAKGGKGKRRKR